MKMLKCTGLSSVFSPRNTAEHAGHRQYQRHSREINTVKSIMITPRQREIVVTLSCIRNKSRKNPRSDYTT